jgi:hypothetical protein
MVTSDQEPFFITYCNEKQGFLLQRKVPDYYWREASLTFCFMDLALRSRFMVGVNF